MTSVVSQFLAMGRFAVICSPSIHTKVYYCTLIVHYARHHQRVAARWIGTIIVLPVFVFVVVSRFFSCYYSLFSFTYHPFSNTFRTLLFVPVAAARRIPFRNSCSIIFNRLDLFLSLSFMSGCNGLTGYVDLLFVPNVPVCVMFCFVFVLNLMKWWSFSLRLFLYFLSFVKASEAATAIARAFLALIPSYGVYRIIQAIDAYGWASEAECRATLRGLSTFAYFVGGVFPKQWGKLALEYVAGFVDEIYGLPRCIITAGSQAAYNFAAWWGGGNGRRTTADEDARLLNRNIRRSQSAALCLQQ